MQILNKNFSCCFFAWDRVKLSCSKLKHQKNVENLPHAVPEGVNRQYKMKFGLELLLMSCATTIRLKQWIDWRMFFMIKMSEKFLASMSISLSISIWFNRFTIYELYVYWILKIIDLEELRIEDWRLDCWTCTELLQWFLFQYQSSRTNIQIFIYNVFSIV